MSDLVCLGEALIDFVAMEPCSDVGASIGFLRAPGGAPANVAVAAARLGCSSSFLGKVGEDPFGRFLARTIGSAGVDVSGMVFDPHHRTGLAFVSLGANGERDFCFFRNPSADMTYAASELDMAAIDRCKALHFGSITLIDAAPRNATLTAVKRARTAGKLISYDPNLRPPLWSSLGVARKRILQGMRFADIVKISEEELCFLYSGSDAVNTTNSADLETYAHKLLRAFRNIALLSVTRGAQGCSWYLRNGTYGEVPGYRVESVDTTGAGDGFGAGVISGLIATGYDRAQSDSLDAESVEPILKRANAVGALATTMKGAIPAMPTSEAVDAFLAAASASTDAG